MYKDYIVVTVGERNKENFFIWCSDLCIQLIDTVHQGREQHGEFLIQESAFS